MKKYLLSLALLGAYSLNAQSLSDNINELKENFDINFYLRSSYEVSDNDAKANAFKLNEARMEIMGNITEDLSFRSRWRMNRQVETSTISNAPGSLDYAYLSYKFGEDKKYALTVGKQMNNFGSWEFFDNPIFEYQYSNYINKQQNLFPVSVEFSYKLNPHHTFHLQAFNPSEYSFDELHENTGYTTNGLEMAKLPYGVNLTWEGKMWDNKFRTIYTVTSSKIAKDKTNFQVSLGHKLVLDKFSGYLDLHHTDMAVDYVNMASPALNTYHTTINPNYTKGFAQDLQFQSAVMRLNYAITPKWHINGKTVFESIYAKNNSDLKHITKHYVNQIALEYKPFEKQDFKIFGYYAHFNTNYADKLKATTPNTQYGMFAIGALWYLNAL
ncbi:porin [Bergeyella porcorum]|uniref:porin n=1 Tax=Bergeyella porcorum TaxID=1735111 RepID=UPI0035E8DFB0